MDCLLRFFYKMLDERDLIRDVYRILIFTVILFFLTVALHKTVVSTIANKDGLFLEKSGYILNKTAWKKPFCNIFTREIPSKIAYEYDGKILSGILSAKSGDTVSVTGGMFYINKEFIPEYSFETDAAISAEFSPRDNLPPFEIPKIGDKIVYAKDDIAAACFLYGIMRQIEDVKLNIILSVNEENKNNFFINDFTLYKGMFADIPDDLKSSKYFWNAFLLWYGENISSGAQLKAEILNSDGNVISGWQVRENYYFITVPHRNGFDSRYTGAIAESKIIGTIGLKLPF